MAENSQACSSRKCNQVPANATRRFPSVQTSHLHYSLALRVASQDPVPMAYRLLHTVDLHLAPDEQCLHELAILGWVGATHINFDKNS
jgi:hypothetical protein